MTVVNVQRRSSTIVYSKKPDEVYPNNRRYLKCELPSVAGPSRIRSFINWAVPTAIREPGAQVESATVTLYPATAETDVEFRLGLITSTWAPGKTTSWKRQPTFETSGYASSKTVTGRRGDPLTFDVLPQVQRWQDGAGMHGLALWTATVKGTGYEVANYGAFLPVLTIEYYLPPTTPRELSPSASQGVDRKDPMLSVQDVNVDVTPVTGIDVELFDDGERVWASGPASTERPQLDLSEYDIPDHAAGAVRAWRVRLRGVGDLWSNWSAQAQYRYMPLGSTRITSPTENAEVTDSSPTVVWENDFTQKHYRLQYVDPARTPSKRVLWDSGLRTSGDTSATTAKSVATEPGKTYQIVLFTYDEVDRAPASQQSVKTVRNYRFSLSDEVAGVSELRLVGLDPVPFGRLEWSRTNIPDEWHIVRDGQVIATALGTDLLVDGETTRFEYTDFGAAPRRTHTWSVRAFEDGAASVVNAIVSTSLEPGGIWLSDPDEGVFLPFITMQDQQIQLSEVGATHYPINATYGVRVSSALRGFSGEVSAELYATPLSGRKTGSELRDEFLKLRDSPGKRLTLTAGDFLWHVVAFDMTVAPTPQPGIDGDYLYAASFSFVEVP